MTHKYQSSEGVKETRHTALMSELIKVANKYGINIPSGESEVEILDHKTIEISTYYYEKYAVRSRVTHLITVESNVCIDELQS